MNKNIVEMNNIVKNFGQVHAVRGSQFNLREGEIHSLIGENGAGKSTMMKLLYGMYEVDDGEIIVNGKQITDMTPKLAIELGIGMVHQEFMLVKDLTVLENIILGFEPTKGVAIDFKEAKTQVEKFIEEYHMDVEINKKVSQISVGEAQRVEIIKALSRGANIIILDEPTAVLTPQESVHLFKILENMKKSGKSIVFISHKLNEVMDISDRISVMRQGKYIGTVNKTETNQSELAKMMIGREVFLNIEKKKANPGEKVLQVNNLWTPGEKEISKIRGISLDVRSGEIVGVAGIDGNGQTEIIEAICGLRKVEKGNIILGENDITNKSVAEIRTMGLNHIPEDRNTRGLNRELSIEDNIVAAQLKEKPFTNHSVMNRKAITDYANKLIKKFDIRTGSSKTPTSSLSGGNAQKVVIAREVSIDGKLLIAAQPTRGVDIGAIESIRSIIQDVKEQGMGVLLISADLEEILSLSDRIVVMHEGNITGKMNADEATEENLGLLMMGGTEKNESEAG